MKKVLCLLLALLLCAGSVPAPAEETRTRDVSGYDFDLRFHLNADSFPAARRARMKGYADLLEALSFRGTFFYEPGDKAVDFTLNLIPDAPGAEPVRLHFYGYTDNLMLSSSLFGEEAVLFSNISLLEFVCKIHEHLGLNLQYGALLYPFVYENSLQWVNRRWKKIFLKPSGSRRITPSRIRNFANYLEGAFSSQPDLELLIRAFCLSGDFEETIRSEIYNLPVWFTETLSRGTVIAVREEPGSEIWAVSKEPIYTHTYTDSEESIFTDLPRTPGGYLPSFSYSRRTENGLSDLSLEAGWTRNGEDDLLSFRFSGDSLPSSWPADADMNGEISLFGALYPNFSFRYALQSDSDGHLLAGIRKISGETVAGENMLTAEGFLLPKNDTIPWYTRQDMDACVDILRVNDVSLAEFKNNIMDTAVMGLIRFLAGIPASACQSMLDDLTDLGILSLLLPD